MELVRRDLLSRPPVTAAMLEAGYSAEIELSPCDGPRDMTQRMNQKEFDLVFTTAVVYARQQGDYGEPILMTYRPGDFKLPRDSGVLRQGVLIAGPTSPLFQKSNTTKTRWAGAWPIRRWPCHRPTRPPVTSIRP
jgi:hypothetical protein